MDTHDHDVLSSNPSSFQIIFLQNFVVVYKGPTINEKETGNFPFLNYPGIEVTLRRLFAYHLFAYYERTIKDCKHTGEGCELKSLGLKS